MGLGEVAYQRNEMEIALQHVTKGIALCRQFVYTPPLAAGLATLAWIRQATGDRAAALDAMGEAGQASLGPPGLFNPVPAQRARLLLAQGDLAEAARWTSECGLTADDEPDYPREPGHLVLTRVLLAQGQPTQALALLDRLHAAAAAQDRVGSLIEIGALRRWRWRPAERRLPRWPPWPGRSRSPARKAMSGSSPTRARRWARCWAAGRGPAGRTRRRPPRPARLPGRLQQAFDAEHPVPDHGRGGPLPRKASSSR